MDAIVRLERSQWRVRIAYTFEQCWRRVPGGTGIAAVEVARELALRSDLEVIGVAGRHRHPPTDGFAPPIAVNALPIGGPLLFESWLRLRWPKVESVVDDTDLVHSTTIIPPATSLPLVVTIHDLAFLRHPDFFTARGNKVFRRSLDIIRDTAAMVLCSSQATIDDCVTAGIDADRLRLVPLGVTTHAITDTDRARVRATYDLPERFILFVGTLEPRKNLARLIAALDSIRGAPPLVVVGMAGWETTLRRPHMTFGLLVLCPHTICLLCMRHAQCLHSHQSWKDTDCQSLKPWPTVRLW